jgi:NAD-dependent SIR2 family protein deacetylase
MTLQAPTSGLLRDKGKYSREDFPTSIYNTGDGTDHFYYMINELSSGMLTAAPTGFHQFLDQLAVSGRLLCHYTRNVDRIETHFTVNFTRP